MDIKIILEQRQNLVNKYLQQVSADLLSRGRLGESMSYSLLAGGKRLRPILCLTGCEAVGGDIQLALPIAAALECVHTYSLIHDDLPAMDNDDLRRGQPTNHKVYGEAMAILAGDGLQSLGFEIISRARGPYQDRGLSANNIQRLNFELAQAIGADGMAGGQALDIAAEGQEIKLADLQRIHQLKTGALIRAAVRMGAIIGQASEQQLKSLTTYAEEIGLAFQIQDDILNVTSTPEQLGKATQSDAEHHKNTYPKLLGLSEAKKLAEQHVQRAIEAVHIFDQAEVLVGLAQFITQRQS